MHLCLFHLILKHRHLHLHKVSPATRFSIFLHVDLVAAGTSHLLLHQGNIWCECETSAPKTRILHWYEAAAAQVANAFTVVCIPVSEREIGSKLFTTTGFYFICILFALSYIANTFRLLLWRQLHFIWSSWDQHGSQALLPKIMYLNRLTVIQPGFGRKKAEAWTLQQQSTSIYTECALTKPLYAHTLAHTHRRRLQFPPLMSVLNSSTRGAPCSIFGECIIMLQLSCLFLFWCCSTLCTLGEPGNPFVALPTWALPWALLIRRSEWVWDKSVCVCARFPSFCTSFLYFLTFYVANKRVHQNIFDFLLTGFV